MSACDVDAWENLQVLLESAYSAMSDAVHDPLTEESGLGGMCARIYCDCAEDEQAGQQRVRDRIKNYESHLHPFLTYHTHMADLFEKIDAGARSTDGQSVKTSATALALFLGDYQKLISTAHEAGATFLTYPCCTAGQYHIGNIMCTLSFNPEGTAQGLTEATKRLSLAIVPCEGTVKFRELLTVGSKITVPAEDPPRDSYRGKLQLVTAKLREYGLRTLQ